MRRFVSGLPCITISGDAVKSGVDIKLLEVDRKRFVRRSVVFILFIAYSPVVGSLFCLLECRRSTTVNTRVETSWLSGRLGRDLQPRNAYSQLGGVIIAGSMVSERDPWMMPDHEPAKALLYQRVRLWLRCI
jgi:hypothetical protein